MQNCYAVNVVLRHYPDFSPVLIASRLSYSTYVSVDHRYLYFEVPKAACSALKHLVLQLENHPTPKFRPTHDETRRDMAIHDRHGLAIKSLMDFTDDQQREILQSPEFLRFLVVRSPYSRLVSTWRSKVLVCEPGFGFIYEQVKGHLPGTDDKDLISFKEFIDYIAGHENLDLCNSHWQRQTVHAFFPAMNFNFIGKTEKLTEVLDRLQQHLGLPARPMLSSKNISGSPSDPRLTRLVAEKIAALYRQDFENFGYDPNVLPHFRSGDSVPAEMFHDEIIERNLIIAAVYAEVQRLRGGSGQREIMSLTRVRDKLRRTFRKR